MSFKRLIQKHSKDIFNASISHYFKTIYRYVIDRNYRKSVNLSNWLEAQIQNPSEQLKLLADKIQSHPTDADQQMMAIFKYIENSRGHMKYVSDSIKWKTIEKWQTVTESAESLTGDCEDGAILMYALARYKGIDVNQLLIFCGEVINPYTKKREGHAYLMYKPLFDPFHWFSMDWCYFPRRERLDRRERFYVKDKKIYLQKALVNNTFTYVEHPIYLNIWWAFNEEYAIKEFTRK